jgi:quercetin dioxygenase-like cupin family protein
MTDKTSLKSSKVSGSIFQLGQKIKEEDLGNGLRRQIFGYNDQVMMVKVLFKQGAIGLLHEHYHTQVTYVESGSFEVTIGADKKILNKGDGFFVPPYTVHGCECLEEGTLIDVFTPYREDFITK